MSTTAPVSPRRIAFFALLLTLLSVPAAVLYAQFGDAQETTIADLPPAPAPAGSVQGLDDLNRALDSAARTSRKHTPKAPKPFDPVTIPAATGFSWPVGGRGAITSPYGERVFQGGREFHHGLDIGCYPGQIIRAAAPAQVAYAGPARIYGNAILLAHGGDWQSLYGHLSRIDVANGQVVAAGDPIGRCGATGRATGPHLHFELRHGGYVYDPLLYLP